ncbi:MAG: AAA family ATPase, partial [Candidatus Omnitrophica bacterium]|nr:AAA family ATPase [Candidatus Omnitrophota bacterium]
MEKYKTKVNTSIYNESNNPQIRETIIANFCCVIEVKKHDAEYIEIKDTKVYVTTNNRKMDATIQNRKQKYSLVRFLEKDIKNDLQVSNIIFFPKCRRDNIGKIPKMNLLFKEFELKDFWEIIMSQRVPKRNYSGELIYSANLSRDSFETYRNMLTTPFKATRLDMRRVNEICKDNIKEQKYGEKLGTQLLIFRGGGGTGKTFRLLNLAHKLYNEKLNRVLILTYNLALIADIQRLFTIMKIRDGIDESIQIKTLHSFWFGLFYIMGIRKKEDMKFKNNYKTKELIDKARQFIKSNPQKLREISMDFPDLLCWDYVMIDEAQDWSKEERDFIYSLFPPENVVIADGYDQLVRTEKGCNWRGSPIVKDCQVINLTKSMRQKSNIVGFLKEFAKRMDIYNFDIEEQDSLHGGKIIIVEGEYTQKFHQELVKNNHEYKNENIDMLFCVPPSNVDKST